MNISKAKSLLRQAEDESDLIRKHLLVAAAFREVLSSDPIVVGGLAQDYYTESYNPTDLDLCIQLSAADRRVITDLGFVRAPPRHWHHPTIHVAVEFPEGRLDGSPSLVRDVAVGVGIARVISPEDLYLDRVKQATMTEREGDISFQGAVAIAVANFGEIDWRYVRRRINEIGTAEPQTGAAMKGIDRRVRRRAREALAPRSKP